MVVIYFATLGLYIAVVLLGLVRYFIAFLERRQLAKSRGHYSDHRMLVMVRINLAIFVCFAVMASASVIFAPPEITPDIVYRTALGRIAAVVAAFLLYHLLSRQEVLFERQLAEEAQESRKQEIEDRRILVKEAIEAAFREKGERISQDAIRRSDDDTRRGDDDARREDDEVRRVDDDERRKLDEERYK
jgi:hypothetical protein